MRKAGIIVGVAILMLAIIILGVTKRMEQGKAGNKVVVTERTPVVVPVEQPKEQPKERPKERPKETVEEEEKEDTKHEVDKRVGRVEEMTVEKLPEHSGTREEVGVIAAKRLLVVEEQGEGANKGLVYVLDILTATNKKVPIYVTEKGYEYNQVGDRVKMKYRLYKGEYSLVESVETIEKANGL